MITIKEAKTRRDLMRFVRLPFRLYKNNPYWVPPVIKDELRSFSKRNPIFKNVEAHFLLAYKGKRVVGRVAAIINKIEVEQLKKPKIRFGWFEVIDDIEVTKALLDKVAQIGKAHNLEYIEGPVGFSNMDKAGMLTDGFDQIATMIGLYNYEYYPKHLEQLGFVKQAEWLEYKFSMKGLNIDNAIALSKVIEKRYNVSSLNFKTTKEIMPYANKMFALLNESYKDLQSFVPIEKFQIEHYKKKYLPLINPEFISCVVDNSTKELVAFAVTIPSLSKAFQKAHGRLYPFGFLHLIQALKNSKNVEFYLIGVHPDYQNKGVTSLIFRELYKTYKKHQIEWIETNPQLEENKKIQLLWKNFNPETHKRRKTFKKDI